MSACGTTEEKPKARLNGGGEWVRIAVRRYAHLRYVQCRGYFIDTGGLKASGKAEVTDQEVALFLLDKAELVSASAGPIVDVHDVKEAKELMRI